jgi:hypothetical protein
MKNIAKFSGIILLILALYCSTRADNKIIQKSFGWHCGGYKLCLRVDFSDNLNQAYLKISRKPLGTDSVAYYQQFLAILPGDSMITELAKSFTDLASRSGLPVVLLVTSFTQSLQYNRQANRINFYYNDLFNGKATCWGKSILTYLLLKKLGYEVSIIYFRAIPLPQGGTDQHVVCAIGSEGPYALFKGCTYIETHNLTPIGYLPIAVGPGQLIGDPRAMYPEHNKNNLSKLGPYRILFHAPGNKLSAESLAGF